MGRTATIRELRPNQIFAISLGESDSRCKAVAKVIDTVVSKLVTPIGVRTLSADHPGLQARTIAAICASAMRHITKARCGHG